MAKGILMEFFKWWLDWWIQNPVLNTLFTFGFIGAMVFSIFLKVWQ